MDCPKCFKRGVTSHMEVTHTYRAGAAGTAQRLMCPDKHCGYVGTAVQVLVAEGTGYRQGPQYGQGAGLLAKKMAAGQVVIEVVKTKR